MANIWPLVIALYFEFVSEQLTGWPYSFLHLNSFQNFPPTFRRFEKRKNFIRETTSGNWCCCPDSDFKNDAILKTKIPLSSFKSFWRPASCRRKPVVIKKWCFGCKFYFFGLADKLIRTFPIFELKFCQQNDIGINSPLGNMFCRSIKTSITHLI